MKTLAERIKTARLDKGMTQEELARAAKVSQSLITKLESGAALESRKITSLAHALGVDTDWLATGQTKRGAPMPPTDNPLIPMDAWDRNTPLHDDEIELPFFREVELAAGAGKCEVQENHGCKLRFARSTLKRAGVDPANAYCVTVSGNSMEPILPDGATVGIDTGKTTITDGKMYALDHQGHLRIKYLYRLPGGNVRLRSYNREEWPDETVAPYDIRILGAVFWYAVML